MMATNSSIHISLGGVKLWRIPKNITAQILVLLPFIAVYTGTVFQNTHHNITTLTKTFAFVYMIVYVLFKQKVNAKLFYGTLVFIPFLIYGVFNTWLFKAGIKDGLRYLFPITVLFYSYAIKEYFNLLLKFVIFFVLINFVTQIFNYINWLRGVRQWFYYETETGLVHYNAVGGILRATGSVVFFGFFGFLNMIAFFLIKFYYKGRFKLLFLGMSLAMLLASFSFKAFGPFLVIMACYYYKHIYKFIIGLAVGLCALYLIFPDKLTVFFNSLVLRIQLYITQGNSARSESYRVMMQELSKGNWFGRGVGLFGGPASTAYDSFYYNVVGFNWFGAEWLELTTTDTYLPHLFVELGLFGALTYLVAIYMPLVQKKIGKAYLVVLAIYFCLTFDFLFSFSLNNLDYLLFSLVFVYPLLYRKNYLPTGQNPSS